MLLTTYDFAAIKTGDLILMSRSAWSSNWIRTITVSRWNHIGIAVKITPEGRVHLTEGRLCLIEAINHEDDYDLLTQTIRSGFRCTPFLNRMKHYRCIGYRPLLHHCTNFIPNVEAFLSEYKETNFFAEANFVNLFLGISFDRKGKERGFSCSMIASRFIRYTTGVVLSNYLLPANFDSEEPSDKLQEVYGPIRLIYLKYDSIMAILGGSLIVLAIILILIFLHQGFL